MTKHEHPPFRMVIEGGKLVPATAYDAERLDSYRRGTAVRVVFTEEKDRPMVRKWWAILGRAIKECKTPWQNKEQASEAIKLALGIVNLSKTVNGAWLQYPKSLTELSDPEVTDAVERMIDVIYHVTGVDASVWRKHVENIRDEEPADVSSIGGQGSDGPQPSPDATTVAADQSGPEDGGPAPAGEIEAREEPSASSAGELSAEERIWLKQGGKMMLACLPSTDPESLRVLIAQLRIIRDLAPKDVGNACLSRMEIIRLHTTGVCKGQHKLDVNLVAKSALCSVEDVMPEPVKVRQ